MATLSSIITPSNITTATNTQTLTNKTLTGAVMNGTVGSTTPSTGAFTTLSASDDVNFDSGKFIDALKPKVGTWKSDGSKFVGFLAHEFAEVSPVSVTGEKDAVNADGEPIYQSMQASTPEVMANIIAELQSLRARVAELEAKA